MWNVDSYYKKFACIVVFIFIIGIFTYSNNIAVVTYAESEVETEQELSDKIDEILGEIDADELNKFIENDFNFEFFNNSDFVDLVKKILAGTFFDSYDSLTDGIISILKENLKSLMLFIFTIFAIIVIFEMFNNFCTNKYVDLKNIVKIIFSIIIALILLNYSKNIFELVVETINKIFNLSKILFPILLGLILMSGATGTHSVYNALSIFILNTGSYIFIYILIPIVLAIIVLLVLNPIFSKNKFSKFISILKSIFKYIIIIFLAIFGIFSSINAVSSGIFDGVNYKITKFAIKSYIPVLGGYLSDGFDFLHTCSVLIKNSFGICGILIIFFIALMPVLRCIVYAFSLKIISVLVSFIGNNSYADYFEKVSSAISYLITIIVGVFMCLFIYIYLLILSVSVI